MRGVPTGRPATARAVRAHGRKGRAHHRGQLHGVSIFQVHDPHAAARADACAGAVQLGNGVANSSQPRRVGRAHDERIAARVGHHRAAAGASGTWHQHLLPTFAQALHQGRHVTGHGMLQGDDFDVGGGGHIERGNDLVDALQVVSVVGDHQAVIALVGVDGVVGADERAQHGHQVVGAFKAQAKNLRDDLVTSNGHVSYRHGAGLQLRVSLRHDLQQTAAFHHRKAQATQG